MNSITCFARCHHGWIYYDSARHPERRHPHLERNLLPEQIAACHARDIRVPIYTTVQWDHYTAERHGLAGHRRDRALDGHAPQGRVSTGGGVNTPYREFFRAHVQRSPRRCPSMASFDIVAPMDCSCFCPGEDDRRLEHPTAARRAFGLQTLND